MGRRRSHRVCEKVPQVLGAPSYSHTEAAAGGPWLTKIPEGYTVLGNLSSSWNTLVIQQRLAGHTRGVRTTESP